MRRRTDGEFNLDEHQAVRIFHRFFFHLQNILGDDGILIYHSMTRTAPLHYALLANFSDFSYWSLINVLHVPATQVSESALSTPCNSIQIDV